MAFGVREAPKIESFSSPKGILYILAVMMCPSSCKKAASNAASETYECVKKRASTIIAPEKLNFILNVFFFIKNLLAKILNLMLQGDIILRFFTEGERSVTL